MIVSKFPKGTAAYSTPQGSGCDSAFSETSSRPDSVGNYMANTTQFLPVELIDAAIVAPQQVGTELIILEVASSTGEDAA